MSPSRVLQHLLSLLLGMALMASAVYTSEAPWLWAISGILLASLGWTKSQVPVDRQTLSVTDEVTPHVEPLAHVPVKAVITKHVQEETRAQNTTEPNAGWFKLSDFITQDGEMMSTTTMTQGILKSLGTKHLQIVMHGRSKTYYVSPQARKYIEKTYAVVHVPLPSKVLTTPPKGWEKVYDLGKDLTKSSANIVRGLVNKYGPDVVVRVMEKGREIWYYDTGILKSLTDLAEPVATQEAETSPNDWIQTSTTHSQFDYLAPTSLPRAIKAGIPKRFVTKINSAYYVEPKAWDKFCRENPHYIGKQQTPDPIEDVQSLAESMSVSPIELLPHLQECQVLVSGQNNSLYLPSALAKQIRDGKPLGGFQSICVRPTEELQDLQDVADKRGEQRDTLLQLYLEVISKESAS